MTTPLLRLSSVACLRGGVTLLEDVSFALEAGQALVLRGPNGSGKTTLLRTIAGLQPAFSGSIEAAPESIAYAAHADGLKSVLSVEENLTFWSGLFGGGDIAPALDAFDLAALRHRRAFALSAGQKRRLGLARLLLTRRSVWVMDEPTVSLDAHAVGQFADMVQAHLAKGGASVIATHTDLDLDAKTLDVSSFRPAAPRVRAFDETFL